MVIVEYDPGFKISDLAAPNKGKYAVGKGKRMIHSRVSNAAPTQVNLPHNSFVQGRRRGVKSSDQRRDEELSQAMRRAAKDGKVADIRALLDRGAKASTALDSYGMTALHYAAWHGRTDAVSLLLSAGSSVDARNKDHKTPLHLAAGNGRARTVRALLRKGASLSALNSDGQTPLDCAEFWGNVETAPALREACHAQAEGKEWRVQSANRLGYPRRVASYKDDGCNDDWAVREGVARAHVRHHVSVQRVGVYPCTEAWR